MKRSRLSSFSLRGLLAAALLALSIPVGCSSEECQGILVDGECQAECKVSACPVPGSICFQNECGAPCTGNEECPVGQNCAAIDQGGVVSTHCYSPEWAKGGKTGQYEPCTANTQCDEGRGFVCSSGECRLPCTKDLECSGIGYCELDAQGQGGCVKAETPMLKYEPCTANFECDQPGGYLCVDGECRLEGCRTHDDCASVGPCENGGKLPDGTVTTSCVKGTTYPEGQFNSGCSGVLGEPTTCDTANGFICIGTLGDVDAYCTKTNCQADSDCALGHYCASTRTGRPPCADTCPGIAAVPGDSTCVPAADIGPGKEFSCGPLLLLRNVCLKREYCNECETDADCLGVANQVCAKGKDGAKMCSALCDPNVSNACPWGTASQCQIWDTDLGVPTCAHRFGACTGTGKGCEPCLDDADCPTGICLESSFTKERYCVDLAPSCDCTGLPVTQGVYCIGGGCPLTPGGLNGVCYGGSQVQSGGSPLYQKCVGSQITPLLGGSPQTACWPTT